jgi:monoamine oxidase
MNKRFLQVCFRNFPAPVAQGIEHRFPKPGVGGSSPPRGTATAHDWLADEFARGTWAIHRPGWFTKYHAEMQRPEGTVVLAGSDLANGWSGFMDGAIESGLRATAQVLHGLSD